MCVSLAGLRREAELGGLCSHPSPPAFITYLAHWTLGTRRHQEKWNMSTETVLRRSTKASWGRALDFDASLPGVILKGGKDKWATQEACCYPHRLGLRIFPPPASRRAVCPVPPGCFLTWLFLRDKSCVPYLWSIPCHMFKLTSDNSASMTHSFGKLKY